MHFLLSDVTVILSHFLAVICLSLLLAAECRCSFYNELMDNFLLFSEIRINLRMILIINDVAVYIVVRRLNGTFVNVQYGNVTTDCCIILLRRPTKLRPATQCQP